MTVAYQEFLFTSKDLLNEKFSSLNIFQIYTLVTSYTPDKYIPEKVPSAIMQSVKKFCDELPKDQKTKENLPFSTIMTLKNIQPVVDISEVSEESSLEVSSEEIII